MIVGDELFKARIGEIVRDARIKQDKSQKDLAVKLGHSSAQAVSNCERGLAPFSIKTLSKVATVLKMDRKKLYKDLLKEMDRCLKEELL